MSNQIPVAMVNQFKMNVFHLAQQKGSLLRNEVRNETQKAEAAFYDYIGVVEARERVGRHSQVEYTDTPHGRRMVTTKDYYHADLVDNVDKLRTLQNPESEYTKSFKMAMGRKIDDVIIEGLLGTSYSGKKGETAVVLPDSQKIAAHTGAALSGLNVKTLRAIRKAFNENELGDEPICMIISAEQLDNMLGETEITSSDYAAIKALVQGEVNSFMGIRFKQMERLPASSTAVKYSVVDGSIDAAGTEIAIGGARRCIAFQKSGVILAVGADVVGKIDSLPDMHYSNQVYFSMTMGSARMEEVKVLEVNVKEA